ncbi:hypothetical protein GCM10009678_06600 [Actinomadura kijaniata]
MLDSSLLHGERQGLRRRLEELCAEVVPGSSGPGDVAFARFADGFEGVPVLPVTELVDAVVSGGGHDVSVPAWFEEERERLAALERERGVTGEHRAATARLRELGARLRHPYVDVTATFRDYTLSPCGRWLATARWDMTDDAGTLQIWEMATGLSVNVIEDIEDGPGWPGYRETVQWSADGTRIAVAFNTNLVGAWEAFGERLDPLGTADVTDGKDAAAIFAFRPDGSGAYISMRGDHEVMGCVAALDRGAVFSNGSGHGDGPGLEQLPEPIPAEFAQRLGHREWFFSRVRWSRDGTRLLGSDGRDRACSVDMPGGRMRWLVRADAPVEFSPDDRRLASVTGGLLRVFDADTGEEAGEPARQAEGSLHWGMRGNAPVLAVVAENGGGVTVHDENGRPLHRLDIATTENTGRGFFEGEQRPWAWAPSGTHGACLTDDGRVEVWSLDGTAARTGSFPVPEGSVAVLWGAGDVLAVLGERTLRFVRALTGEAVGDHTFGEDGEDGEGEPPVEREDLLHGVFEADPFPLAGQGWGVLASPAAGPGAALVITDGENRDDLDAVLAWVVGRRFAWPVRWGDLDVVPDIEAAEDRLAR